VVPIVIKSAILFKTFLTRLFLGNLLQKVVRLLHPYYYYFYLPCKKDLQEQLLNENQTTSIASAATASIVTKVEAENYSTMYGINTAGR